jgi:uncharacterized protein (TIGR00251 family)
MRQPLKKQTYDITFFVKIIPNSPKNEIIGKENDFLKIRIKAPPEKGKANKALISLLSKTFKTQKSNIKIISGKTSKIKKVIICNLKGK